MEIETSTLLADACIMMLMNIVNACLDWWSAIVASVGLTPLWVGVVVLFGLFSIVLVPMRSGQLLGGGALGSFARTKINNHRKSNNNHTGDD